MPSPSLNFAALFRLARPYQWVKNLLLFLPLIAAHQLNRGDRDLKALIAFFAFSLVASAGYVLNDFLDREVDRRHPEKQNRPLASGQVSGRQAFVLFLGLVGTGMAFALTLGGALAGLVALYLIFSVGYSVYLKQLVGVDVCALALLYTLRIFAGGAATEIPVSHWLLAFSAFFFLGLALVKRYSELIRRGDNNAAPSRRGYVAQDQLPVLALGAVSSLLSVLVLAFYVNGPESQQLYRHPYIVWGLCPLLTMWVIRLWVLCHRGEIPHDPILFALRDKFSYAVALSGLAILFLAR